MKKNRILDLTLVVLRAFKFFFLLLSVVVIGFTIYWTINPEAFNIFRIESGWLLFKFTTGSDIVRNNLAEMSLLHVYFISTRSLAIIFLLLMIMGNVTKIIKAMESLETFKARNSQVFRKIGILFLIWFGVEVFNISLVGDQYKVMLHFSFNQLIWALVSFLLAEIFMEGNRLMEENNLTI